MQTIHIEADGSSPSVVIRSSHTDPVVLWSPYVGDPYDLMETFASSDDGAKQLVQRVADLGGRANVAKGHKGTRPLATWVDGAFRFEGIPDDLTRWAGGRGLGATVTPSYLKTRDLATRFGVSTQTIVNWSCVHDDFPKPIEGTWRPQLWNWPEVEDWAAGKVHVIPAITRWAKRVGKVKEQ